MRTLLAVDLGLRTGLALFSDEARLIWYRSQNYGSIARLKRAVYRIYSENGSIDHVVIEGGGNLAQPWIREARKRGIESRLVHADQWRERILLPREQTGSARAKHSAGDLAHKVIEWGMGKKPTSLRHDAAEAILIGLWGLEAVGWIDGLPDFIR